MLTIIIPYKLYLPWHYSMTGTLVRMEWSAREGSRGPQKGKWNGRTNMDFIIRKFGPNFHYLMLLDKQNSWMISGGG